ncbi:Cytochrome c oxidase assembly protein COX11, mitochondrial [Candida viswanathii]|uniref:Cytochrome c oxidase assembly protein COX11, mitochondrial n=1 Tax=Candida viswanathii TaxID=5486 RepID=A0A367XYU6_9ASCO|nr:Cytochrome c oxidase assembly protein COX11, mitochondrial [Candida viswanathii]
MNKAREERQKFRNKTATYYSISLGVFFLALSFAAVPIYRAIVSVQDSAKFTPDKLIPVDTNKRIRVSFTCQASGYCHGTKNLSKEAITGMATYSITPEPAAGYFDKIHIGPGEEVDMPVFFFIDPDFAKDPAMHPIDDIVLHYSFFKTE